VYLEVEGDEGEHEAFEVLDEVVKNAQPFWVIALLHIQQRADLRALQTNNQVDETKTKDDQQLSRVKDMLMMHAAGGASGGHVF